ncbi:hypothetical protein PHMEG_00026216 [Phytophthora megakarya]|uniref:RxLR effector protein n=1 Tax=Phytophthora megakarya TaxID=4795 RepID=A0A225VA48_9STRA|nr:hypothetical protein PHMEG_00026216 [Phytophthora megakarya]
MRVTLVLLAVFAISIVNAATNTASSPLLATTSTGLVNSIDTGLDNTKNNRFLRSDKNLNGDNTNNEEERSVLSKLGSFLGLSKNKYTAVTPEELLVKSKKLSSKQLKAAAQKLKISPEQLKVASQKIDDIPDKLKITEKELMGLPQGRTRDVFAKWAENKVLPDDIWPMLKGLSQKDKNQVHYWYKTDIYRGGHWNVR